MRMLIVDDSRAMRMLVRRTLRQAGLDEHDIQEAGDGAEALTMISGWQPDLVLSDWNMPNMDGIDLLQKLRQQGNTVAFGFVTSEGTEDKRELASECGALFLIAKPFDADTFKQLVGPVLCQ